MKTYSQKDSRWANERLGSCTNLIKTDGCFLVSLSMLAEIDPKEANAILTTKGGYSSGCMMNSPAAAPLLGLEYQGKAYKDPGFLCVAETDHYKSSGFSQHFFVFEKGKIVDPLDKDPKWKANPYRIVSYRLFVKKPMAKSYYIVSELRNALKKIWKDFDHEKESSQEKMGGKLEDYLDTYNAEEIQKAILSGAETKELEMKDTIEKMKTVNEIQAETIDELEDTLKEKDGIIYELKKNANTDNTGYVDVNTFDLGKWRFIIKSKQ